MLEEIRDWINGQGTHGDTQAFLLLGPAGIGKSAILHRIAEECNTAQRLAASFCFSPDRGVDNFFRTIARSIAALDSRFASVVAAVTAQDPTLQHTTVLSSQIKYLLLEPFESLSIVGTIVIVIDALDECHSERRDELVQCLYHYLPSFPKNIRFLITSRPSEAKVLSEVSWIHACLLNTATTNDLHMFVEHQLTDCWTGNLLQGFGKPEVQKIISAAEGLFQHAYVVCKEIRNADKDKWENPLAVFNDLITNGSRGLDGLYSHILSNAYSIFLHDTSIQEVPPKLMHFRKVMGWILYAQGRLSQQILLEFGSTDLSSAKSHSNKGYGPVAGVLKPLAALLSGTENNAGKVYPLHSSFRDFLTREECSGPFYIGSELTHHADIATICLKVMKQELHFNMANLQSSYILNCDVPDFLAQVNAGISQGLSYACRNWALHLEMSHRTETEFVGTQMVSNLLQGSFIFYLEVLSLEQETEKAVSTHTFLMNWTTVSSLLTSEIYSNILV